MKKVYIYQFEQWWSTDLDIWVRWLQKYLESPYFWSLNRSFRRLANTPYHAVLATGIDRKSYMTRSATDLIVWMPCDWTIDTYKLALEEALELAKMTT